jgi:hypothetical protein
LKAVVDEIKEENAELKVENVKMKEEIETLLFINNEFGEEVERLKDLNKPALELIVVIEPLQISAGEESTAKSSQETDESYKESSIGESSIGESSAGESSVGESDKSSENSGDEDTKTVRIQPGRKAKGKSVVIEQEFDKAEARVILIHFYNI